MYMGYLFFINFEMNVLKVLYGKGQFTCEKRISGQKQNSRDGGLGVTAIYLYAQYGNVPKQGDLKMDPNIL